MKAGLRMPGEQECRNCHIEKGSHTAVLHSPQYDFKKALETIRHSAGEGPPSGARRLRCAARREGERPRSPVRRPAASATGAPGWATSIACGR